MRRHKFRMNMDVLLVSKFISVSMYVHCVLTGREGVLANNGITPEIIPVWIRMWTLFFMLALFFLHELSHVLSQPGKSQRRIGSRGFLRTLFRVLFFSQKGVGKICHRNICHALEKAQNKFFKNLIKTPLLWLSSMLLFWPFYVLVWVSSLLVVKIRRLKLLPSCSVKRCQTEVPRFFEVDTS